MARKRKKKNPTKRSAARFKVGDQVRVRRGMKDLEYPDLPLGGWAGVITELHRDGIYTVRWTEETLAAIDPVFLKRCERDGMDHEEYCLGEDDVEPDGGGPFKIEQPEQITTEPLSIDDEEDRVRMALGLTSNDPLPDVDDETLQTYYHYLAKKLAFPFEAEVPPGFGSADHINVVGLGDPEEPLIEEDYGIFCEARIGRRFFNPPLAEINRIQGQSNRQLALILKRLDRMKFRSVSPRWCVPCSTKS